MTRIFLLIICLLCMKDLSGQEKDFRARLNVSGGINKISVLADGSIWLGTMTGELYYTDAFDRSWHYEFREIPGRGGDKYEKVIGLNRKTILVLGQISKNGGYHPDAVLRSTNGGKDWATVRFTETGETQIEAVDYNPEKKASR